MSHWVKLAAHTDIKIKNLNQEVYRSLTLWIYTTLKSNEVIEKGASTVVTYKGCIVFGFSKWKLIRFLEEKVKDLEAYLATLILICANKKFLEKSEVCLQTQHSNVAGQLGLHSTLLGQLQFHTACQVWVDVVYKVRLV